MSFIHACNKESESYIVQYITYSEDIHLEKHIFQVSKVITCTINRGQIYTSSIFVRIGIFSINS